MSDSPEQEPQSPSSSTRPGHESVALRILRVAEEEMARGVGEVGGDNQGPDVLRWMNYDNPRTMREGGPWCAAWASWIGVQVMGEKFPGSISATRMATRMQTQWGITTNVHKDGFLPDMPVPRPGDYLFSEGSEKDEKAGHVGIVRGFDPATGIITCIAGNAGKAPCKVMLQRHHITDKNVLSWATPKE